MVLIDAEQVKSYLNKTYGLGPEQVETMLISLKDSLNLEFNNAEDGLAAEDATVIWKAAHAMKGALLMTGANEWGECARKIELSAKAGEEADYEGLFNELKSGVSAIL